MDESQRQEYLSRWAELEKLQEHYKDFRDFYADVSEMLLGFTPTWMQYDIADYVANGPLWSMVQAQRGQAKTTIAGCYAIWRLIHDPTTRVLIISAGTTMAKEISTWCIQILNNMPELEILRCDRTRDGARASVEAYDVHWMLKGSDKAPSIKCMGITSSLQGSRADLLIPDDIESSKNSLTQLMREQLNHLTKDFSSINSHGKILYLGTPQSIDSVYNDLPSRGFDVRIWPGRYPSVKAQNEVYGDALAPSLVKNMILNPNLRTGYGLDGTLGAPTDPGMMSEDTLNKKYADQGPAYFNLQFMLNTALMDQDKYPLKLRNLQFYDIPPDECPGAFYWSTDPTCRLEHHAGSNLHKEFIYQPARVSPEFFHYNTRLISIDTAGRGQNNDETGVAVIYECNGFLLLMHVTGVQGGTSVESIAEVVSIIKKYKCNTAIIERNFGDGAYAEALRGALLAAAGNETDPYDYRCDIEEVWSTGQKELRIVDSLDPVLGTHKLIVNKSVIEHDVLSTQKYPTAMRSSYQFLFQMAKITRDRGSLIHDDRLEAVAQGVRYLITRISINAEKEIAKKKQQKLIEMQQDPYGVWRHSHTSMAAISMAAKGSPFDRFTRK